MAEARSGRALGIAFLRGGKQKWTETDIVFLEECLKKELRTYNSRQLTEKLERDKLSA
ncbi:hypothetical protein [Nostoc sp.]|uniref:hypothetical protein n=1 Tax=Nostoc sp. TaxID=1180 RepID=UPI002FFD09DE